MATAAQLLKGAILRLKQGGIDEPEANAQWLLAAAMGKKRLELLADLQCEAGKTEQAKFEQHIQKKEQGIPLAYILGNQDFIDISLKVDSRVLVPRPETEELAEFACNYAQKLLENGGKGRKIRILDYGCGSGAIGFWLLHKLPQAELAAADKSPDALACAKENAAMLGLEKRITFLRTDSPAEIQGNFELIVSNPPYIPSGVIPGLAPEVLCEPHIALDGGQDGLAVARLVFREAARLLVPGGALFMELSGGDPARLSEENIPRVFLQSWQEIKGLKDFSGQTRFLFAAKK
ncbi:MAG: peptide chain release factor N(5)-glutamine methyltransferase [Elusimicrobiales bacterium]|nr:peptide chain release factor N(5)-glutamine methyltransferase [Elusimicrobiales bacterium]